MQISEEAKVCSRDIQVRCPGFLHHGVKSPEPGNKATAGQVPDHRDISAATEDTKGKAMP